MAEGGGLKVELPEFIAKTKALIEMYEEKLITDEQLLEQLPLESLMLARVKKNPSGRLSQHQPPIQNVPDTLAHELSWAREGKLYSDPQILQQKRDKDGKARKDFGESD
jgi:hypothetical protein